MYSILDLSEIIFGLVVENEILPNAVNIKYLEQPYKDGIKYILDGNKKSREQIISNVCILVVFIQSLTMTSPAYMFFKCEYGEGTKQQLNMV